MAFGVAVGNGILHARNGRNQYQTPFRQSTRDFAAWTRTPRNAPYHIRPIIGAFDVFLILVRTSLPVDIRCLVCCYAMYPLTALTTAVCSRQTHYGQYIYRGHAADVLSYLSDTAAPEKLNQLRFNYEGQYSHRCCLCSCCRCGAGAGQASSSVYYRDCARTDGADHRRGAMGALFCK